MHWNLGMAEASILLVRFPIFFRVFSLRRLIPQLLDLSLEANLQDLLLRFCLLHLHRFGYHHDDIYNWWSCFWPHKLLGRCGWDTSGGFQRTLFIYSYDLIIVVSMTWLLAPLGALIVSPFRDPSSPVQSSPVQHLALIVPICSIWPWMTRPDLVRYLWVLWGTFGYFEVLLGT